MEYLLNSQDNKLQEIVKILINKAEPLRIILFGSYAIGKNKLDSDYDICVIKESTFDLNTLEKKLYIDLHSTGEAIDLIVASPEKFQSASEQKYSIFKEIATKGKIIYERSR